MTLKKSTIILREVADKPIRFWIKYIAEAEEYDKEFLEKYNGSMDSTMIFVSPLACL